MSEALAEAVIDMAKAQQSVPDDYEMMAHDVLGIALREGQSMRSARKIAAMLREFVTQLKPPPVEIGENDL